MVPTRWGLFDMIDERMTDEVNDELEYVGPIRGSASFNIVATYLDQIKRRGAFALLRPHALERAQKGFEDLENVVSTLINERPALEKFRDDVVSILRHAREMTNTETNMALGAIQHENAKARYEGRIYFADGILLKFTTAHWRIHGDGYRTMDEAPGRSFDELPECNFFQRRYKKAVAKAIIAAELESILSGGGFDCDRHERQYHVHKNTIIALDHGGESLDPPSEEDRLRLASIVGHIVTAAVEEKDIKAAMLEAMGGSEGNDDYTQRLRKGLLSLSFILQFVDSRDIAGIISSCITSGQVCAEVQEELIRSLPQNSIYSKFYELPAWIQNISSWSLSKLVRLRGPTTQHPPSPADEKPSGKDTYS